MVVGNQYLHSKPVCSGHAFHTGDAVVYGNQYVRLGLRRELHNFRRQAVTIFKPVGHNKIHARAEHLQPAHAYRTGGCAISIVIGDDQQPALRGDRVGQNACHALRIFQLRKWQ